MARSERYIPPTEAQLQQLKDAELAKQKHNENRRKLTEKALRCQRKDTLIQLLTKLCDENIHARWSIEAKLEMPKSIDLILHDLREAIRLATKVDEKRLNYNFAVDWEAYAEVNRLMELLVSTGTRDEAMEIAIHFMEKASHQIECSDEGLMLEEVEACLQPVLKLLESLDEAQRASWAFRMQVADSVGLICHERLQSWSSQNRQ